MGFKKVTFEGKRVSDKPPEERSMNKNIDWNKLKLRMNPKRSPPRKYLTGLKSFDDWTGGIPYGATVIYGSAGCGKSLLVYNIALRAEHCLYFCSEVFSDAPSHTEYPNVDIIDYTNPTYRPHWRKALEELDAFIEHLSPTLVIIDSITAFLSRTKKAVKEADVPEGLSVIHSKYEGIVPIICISEIRGVGYSRSTAGGESVKHNNSLLIEMDHIVVSFASQQEQYSAELGEEIYTLRTVKDKHNLSTTKQGKVILDIDDVPNIVPSRTPSAKTGIWGNGK